MVSGYRSPVLSHRRRGFRVWSSFTSKPKGSNSMETLLSVVKRRAEIKILTSLEESFEA
ncbi:hypothetical protein HanXRQr2_Chr08g0324701 [Helianthus annuus]|uniref:Uncharacterized protein n=1 Tax=Helianthus annuus TaxID=4232 RepID=A0A251U2Q0_HELAN|nr:hypothetical protein HanXRQr2_Chr08g0324701 [Helianthus annuus]